MFPAQPGDILYKKEKDSMLTLTSAKRVILLLVCLNVVTICTAVTIISSGMWVANANSRINCVVDTPVFHSFKSGQNRQYRGRMVANSEGNQKIAHLDITFTGTAPTSNSDRGNLTAVDFKATAVTNSFKFKTIQGNELDTSVITALSDFTVNIQEGGKIHFI